MVNEGDRKAAIEKGKMPARADQFIYSGEPGHESITLAPSLRPPAVQPEQMLDLIQQHVTNTRSSQYNQVQPKLEPDLLPFPMLPAPLVSAASRGWIHSNISNKSTNEDGPLDLAADAVTRELRYFADNPQIADELSKQRLENMASTAHLFLNNLLLYLIYGSCPTHPTSDATE